MIVGHCYLLIFEIVIACLHDCRLMLPLNFLKL